MSLVKFMGKVIVEDVKETEGIASHTIHTAIDEFVERVLEKEGKFEFIHAYDDGTQLYRLTDRWADKTSVYQVFKKDGKYYVLEGNIITSYSRLEMALKVMWDLELRKIKEKELEELKELDPDLFQ